MHSESCPCSGARERSQSEGSVVPGNSPECEWAWKVLAPDHVRQRERLHRIPASSRKPSSPLEAMAVVRERSLRRGCCGPTRLAQIFGFLWNECCCVFLGAMRRNIALRQYPCHERSSHQRTGLQVNLREAYKFFLRQNARQLCSQRNDGRGRTRTCYSFPRGRCLWLLVLYRGGIWYLCERRRHARAVSSRRGQEAPQLCRRRSHARRESRSPRSCRATLQAPPGTRVRVGATARAEEWGTPRRSCRSRAAPNLQLPSRESTSILPPGARGSTGRAAPRRRTSGSGQRRPRPPHQPLCSWQARSTSSAGRDARVERGSCRPGLAAVSVDTQPRRRCGDCLCPPCVLGPRGASQGMPATRLAHLLRRTSESEACYPARFKPQGRR
mmetsp:Transcript_9009/g.26160  ORF Transcript_9009/g.26160 Transcript_9009/m.26160 type:complete len:385 (+) Transcript_9009:120-1274(+)